MVDRGHVKNGVVVLDGHCALPEGTAVMVAPADSGQAQTKSGDLWAGLMEFAGTVPGLPADLARNHDHYIHGAPRK